MGVSGERRVKARLTATLVALVLFVPTVLAEQNDAGTGADAGGTRATATTLPYPGAYNASFKGPDVDWYRLGTSATAPLCATATMTSGPASRLSLFAGDQAAHARSSDSAQPTVSLSVPGTGEVFSRHESLTTPGGAYGFTLSLQGVPSRSLGDALSGTDAGSSLSTALPLKTGCAGGRLSTLDSFSDTVDVYAVQLVAGQEFTYSFAATDATAIRLSLIDQSNVAVAPTLASGGVATFVPSTGGLYYLTVTSSSSTVQETGYVLGTTMGPPDPGNPCRPQC